MLYRRACMRMRSQAAAGLLSCRHLSWHTPHAVPQPAAVLSSRSLVCPSRAATATCMQRRHTSSTTTTDCSSNSSSSSATQSTAEDEKIGEDCYPIVQYPARTLCERPYPLDLSALRAGEYDEMIARLKATRHYYQYPSLCATQIGWNVQVFTLSDDSVYVNPSHVEAEAWAVEAKAKGVPVMQYEEKQIAELRRGGQTGFAWEPCASCCHMLYYIERPLTLHLRAYDERGAALEVKLAGMRARMALHEMDHMQGILFARRVVDTDHVVPLTGFAIMSDWSDDYPSLEARSTFLYTIFTPPYHFRSEAVPDAGLLDRHFEDGIYPGVAFLLKQQMVNASLQAMQRSRWQAEKQTRQLSSSGAGESAENEVKKAGDEDEEEGGDAGDEAAMTSDMEKKAAMTTATQQKEEEEGRPTAAS